MYPVHETILMIINRVCVYGDWEFWRFLSCARGWI